LTICWRSDTLANGAGYAVIFMLTKDKLDKICSLAKLKIDDNSDQKFVEKLNSVFEWIDQLSKIDVSGVELYDQLDCVEAGRSDIDSTPERIDEPMMTNTRDDVLSNSKHKKFGMFSVPKVI
jgi:aspartyl/glutamyl-tRNA(Asn/Gln) amidotransferase C subunit